MSLPETSKSHQKRSDTNFYYKYMSGAGVDIGYRGNGLTNPAPVLPTAIGIELDTPGYDGTNLPLSNLDYVFSSHMLEHHPDPIAAIQAMHAAVKVGGHVVIIVPHQHLYEKKLNRPSRWNADHKTFYTPAKLLEHIEMALEANTYRVVHLRDNDDGFDYGIGPDKHSGGCYEIEVVIKKIQKPEWRLA